jgi:tRNA1(Val) A37 N6-methylase TrmN6
MAAAEPVDVTEDTVLGGRLALRQPRKGHRVGHDAILLAAAVSAHAGDQVVDLGAGVGAAGLAVARRVDDVAVTLVEIDPALVALARHNVVRNALTARVRAVCLDVTTPAAALAAAGLAADAADHVLMNPPFNAAENPSPDRGRRLAHMAVHDTLIGWTAAAARLLRPAGVLTLIWRADGLEDVLAALAAEFGGIAVRPVHPKPDTAAIRVLVRAVKGSRAPLTLRPGLVLADAQGQPTAAAETVLRAGAALTWADG